MFKVKSPLIFQDLKGQVPQNSSNQYNSKMVSFVLLAIHDPNVSKSFIISTQLSQPYLRASYST